uniref:Uncharacterized protein n=1 Tax=Syphacia muris TaxID=451379 RepID=A0A0N5AZE3_9BILA
MLQWPLVIVMLLLDTLSPVALATADIGSDKLFTINTWITKDVSSTSSTQSSDLSPSQHNNTSEERNPSINMDNTKSELLRILQSQVVVKEDVATHEKIPTITEAKFRIALEKVLKRKFGESSYMLSNQRLSSSSTINTTTAKPCKLIHYTSSLDSQTNLFSASAFSSPLVCQFFVFGTLFGVVCSISTCTWCLKPNTETPSTPTSEVNPTNVPAPIDYSKPYMIKCDSRGSCYASPLDDDEVPPLPSYADALECPKEPTYSSNSKLQDSSNSINTV